MYFLYHSIYHRKTKYCNVSFLPMTCSPTVYCPLWWQPWFLLDVCQLICHSHGFGYMSQIYVGYMSLQRTWCTVTNASVIFHCSWSNLACRFPITEVRPAVSAPLYANGREETRAGLSHTMNEIRGGKSTKIFYSSKSTITLVKHFT